LNDICGEAGRWDLMARCVQATLFIAHGLREDSELVLVLRGPPDPPKAIRVSGAQARRFNPDERSTVALLSRALDVGLPASGREVGSTPGVLVSRRGLAEVLDACDDGPIVLLDEEGPLNGHDLPDLLVAGSATFVLGDNNGLTDEQFSEVRSRRPLEVTLGPVPLHADHCIAIVHNILDREASVG
jgi:tRNA (pseudouridine54-N1)-methyltransferase